MECPVLYVCWFGEKQFLIDLTWSLPETCCVCGILPAKHLLFFFALHEKSSPRPNYAMPIISFTVFVFICYCNTYSFFSVYLLHITGVCCDNNVNKTTIIQIIGQGCQWRGKVRTLNRCCERYNYVFRKNQGTQHILPKWNIPDNLLPLTVMVHNWGFATGKWS